MFDYNSFPGQAPHFHELHGLIGMLYPFNDSGNMFLELCKGNHEAKMPNIPDPIDIK